MKKLLLVLALLIPAVLPAQEAVTLTTPKVTTATVCKVDAVLLYLKDATVRANISCDDGSTQIKQYDPTTTPTGASLLSSLNVSVNSAGNSLIKKVYARLSADGVLVGTVTGTAQ